MTARVFQVKASGSNEVINLDFLFSVVSLAEKSVTERSFDHVEILTRPYEWNFGKKENRFREKIRIKIETFEAFGARLFFFLVKARKKLTEFSVADIFFGSALNLKKKVCVDFFVGKKAAKRGQDFLMTLNVRLRSKLFLSQVCLFTWSETPESKRASSCCCSSCCCCSSSSC